MEKRIITIISNKTQSNFTVETDATTLGELKQALDREGIEYDGCVFSECLTNTEMKDDNSILPTQVTNPETGQPTDELIFMITSQKKKISNGAVSSRADAYAVIKSKGLGDAIKAKYGKNFTNLPTPTLLEYVNGISIVKAPAAKNTCKAKEEAKPEVKPQNTAKDNSDKCNNGDCKAYIDKAITEFAQALVDDHILSAERANTILKSADIKSSVNKPTQKASPYSAAFLNRFRK